MQRKSKSILPVSTENNFRKISTEELLSIFVDFKFEDNSIGIVNKVLEYLRSKNNDIITANELLQFNGIRIRKHLRPFLLSKT